MPSQRPTKTRPSGEEAVQRAIAERESAKAVLSEYVAENAEVLTTYQAMVEAHAKLEEEVRTAIRSAAAFNPDTKTIEFAPGYKFIRPVERKVNTVKLMEFAPSFAAEHPEVFTIKANDLDALVDAGEFDARVRNDVIEESFGSPRCYVPTPSK